MRRVDLYCRAQDIAFRSLGTDRTRWGSGFAITHRAIEDPLAAWCLTESIVALAEEWRRAEDADQA